VLVTEECLLNPNRNPALSQGEIESQLRAYLGVTAILWLGQGVVNDETNGHVDNLACFVKPGVVMLHWCDDPQDPQHAVSRDALERLRLARDARGRRIEVIKLPMPGPLELTAAEAAGVLESETSHQRLAGSRLAGSYVNFYLCNKGVVMPLLDKKTDRLAAARIKRAFPGRHVLGVPAREILLGGGNIHCITQQVPR
jgi:agmatine deiminase